LRQALDLRPYRIAQLYRAATKELVCDLAAVTVLPLELRSRLESDGFELESLAPVAIQHSGDGQTTKGLFRLADGAEVEAVLMEHHGGRSTVCISSQAGCAFKCTFCATGQAGFSRNLEAIEIFDQARYFACELAARSKRITNVVFMGMGEPFHNYAAVLDAVRILNDPHGFGLGHRHITISTVGLVPQIDAFAAEAVGVNLAISLHAPTDEQRSRIMPVNDRYPIADLMAACERYRERTRRKIFFEYVMLEGINDDPASARALAARMRKRLASMQRTWPGKVLVISEFGAEANTLNPPGSPVSDSFQARLLERHISVYEHDQKLTGMLIWNLRDYPLVLGTTLVMAFMVVAVNLAVDLAYGLIDPRIKL